MAKKKAKAKAKPRKAAKGTGPSGRTPAQRAKIDARASAASAKQKSEGRKAAKRDKAFAVACPSCRAQAGVLWCFDRQGRQVATPHRLRVELAAGRKPQSIAGALAPLITETAGNKGRAARPPALPIVRIAIDQIKLVDRHRKDFGDLQALARSINDRGGLIQPIAIRPDRTLIDGERRMKAWELSIFAGQPIPCHVLDVDALIAGEWDANAQRKDFTPSEAVKIQRVLESVLAKAKASRATASKAAPGRKASGTAAGRAKDKVAAVTGIKRRTLEKAAEVVTAAERDPEKFGDLVDEMDKTGKVNAPFQKLKVREARAAIVKAPPQLPMKGPYSVFVLDYPWPAEGDRDQASIDAADRAWRPYPEMAIKDGCVFMRDQIAPLLADDVTGYFWVTNFHLVRGYAHHLIGALGFADKGVTMLTWPKDTVGRGRSGFRDQTEHVIVLRRGKPLVDGFGADPPSTLLPMSARGENSQKPVAFYELVERVTPAARYAEFFSTGAHGRPNWDCHGDQAGKHATAAAAILAQIEPAPPWAAPALAGVDADVTSPNALRAAEAAAPAADVTPAEFGQWAADDAMRHGDAVVDDLAALEAIAGGSWKAIADKPGATLTFDRLTRERCITGTRKPRLTKPGERRLADLRGERDERRQLAALPDDVDQLVVLYAGELRRRHDAVVAGDGAAAAAATDAIDRLMIKANGGERHGCALDGSPAERLRVDAAAAIGQVPIWGQRGVFELTVDGVPYLVAHNENCSIDVYAEDLRLPFVSDSGFVSVYSGMMRGAVVGRDVLLHAERAIRDRIATDVGAGGKSKARGALPLPSTAYRMPRTWQETNGEARAIAVDGHDANGETAEAAASDAGEAKPKGEGDQIDLEDAIAAAPPAAAGDDQLEIPPFLKVENRDKWGAAGAVTTEAAT